MSELKTIFVEGREITIGESKILIKSIALKDIPEAVLLVSKFMTIIQSENNLELLKAVAANIDAFKSLIKISTDLKDDVIPELNAGATALIVKEVVKENMDFLRLYVLPHLSEVLPKKK